LGRATVTKPPFPIISRVVAHSGLHTVSQVDVFADEDEDVSVEPCCALLFAAVSIARPGMLLLSGSAADPEDFPRTSSVQGIFLYVVIDAFGSMGRRA
jgi:hypothetical protein